MRLYSVPSHQSEQLTNNKRKIQPYTQYILVKVRVISMKLEKLTPIMFLRIDLQGLQDSRRSGSMRFSCDWGQAPGWVTAPKEKTDGQYWRAHTNRKIGRSDHLDTKISKFMRSLIGKQTATNCLEDYWSGSSRHSTVSRMTESRGFVQFIPVFFVFVWIPHTINQSVCMLEGRGNSRLLIVLAELRRTTRSLCAT